MDTTTTTTTPPPKMGAAHTHLMRRLRHLHEVQVRMGLVLKRALAQGRKCGYGDEIAVLVVYHKESVAKLEPYLDGSFFVEEHKQLMNQEQHAATATSTATAATTATVASPLASTTRPAAKAKMPAKKGRHGTGSRARKPKHEAQRVTIICAKEKVSSE